VPWSLLGLKCTPGTKGPCLSLPCSERSCPVETLHGVQTSVLMGVFVVVFIFMPLFLILFLCVVLGIKLKLVLDIHSTTELHPQPFVALN
jgi:hypothetical protein